MSTAVPFLSVAVAWFVIFGIFLLIILACCCCCNGGESNDDDDYSKALHHLSLTLLILCTIAAMYLSHSIYLSVFKQIYIYIYIYISWISNKAYINWLCQRWMRCSVLWSGEVSWKHFQHTWLRCESGSNHSWKPQERDKLFWFS